MASEYELRDQVLKMIQNDGQISAAVTEAIRLRKRDWLTNLVQTVATGMRIVNRVAQIIHSVVDWLVDLFS